jgi:hypothetical protein
MQQHADTTASVAIFAPIAVAACFTFLSIWLSGRNATKTAQRQDHLASQLKLAEFRQAWINELRECFSELQALALTTDYSTQSMKEAYRLAIKVRLLMNASDARYNELSGLLEAVVGNADPLGKGKLVRTLIPLCQTILKTEWEVLKKDLTTYQH